MLAPIPVLAPSAHRADDITRTMTAAADPSELERLQIDWQRVYGVGTYGSTYGAVDCITGERLAVKVIKTSR